jgi:hypothetical protein
MRYVLGGFDADSVYVGLGDALREFDERVG